MVIRIVFKGLQINIVNPPPFNQMLVHLCPPSSQETFKDSICTLYRLWEQRNFPSD